MNSGHLNEPSPPWMLVVETSPAGSYELAWRLASERGAVRVLRGHKMRTAAALFNEVAAALQFPDYFGENWPALDECLTDLSWLPAERYVIVIIRADEVLVEEGPEMIALLGDVFVRASETWAKPVAQGEPWDRSAVPFHVILQWSHGESDKGMERWGQSYTRFTE